MKSLLSRVDDQISVIVVLTAVALFTGPLWIPDYLNGPVQLIAIYSIASLGVTITLGYAGQFTLGYGAVYAAGAYAAALLTVKQGWPVWLGFVSAMVVGGVIGVLLGLPALRLNSHYLGMITLGFAIVTPQLLRAWDGLTGGFAGLSGINRPQLGGKEISSRGYYYIVAACCVVAMWLVSNLLRSRWRMALLAVHDDPLAASALSVPVYSVKVVAFLIASILAGLAGALYSSYIGFISPDLFGVEISILFLTIVVIGGPLSIAGPIIGSVIFVLVPQELASIRDYSVLIYGAVLVFAPIVIPDGLAGGMKRVVGWRRRLRRPAAATGSAQEMTRLSEATVGTDAFHVPDWLRRVRATGLDAEPVLVAVGLHKAFGGVVAVDGMDLRVRPGCVHALLGPNGSGKTTVLNLLSGVYRPDRGAVVLHDRDMTGQRPHSMARAGIGRTFQTPRLFGHLNVAENVMVSLFSAGKATLPEIFLRLPRARREFVDQRRRADDVLRFVGLYAERDAAVGSLPLGKQRLLEVARALAASPDVLLLDEPAAGLSGIELDALVDMIRTIRELGYGVLLVEHHVEMVFELADEVTVLEGGSCIASGDPDFVQSAPQVVEAYLGF